MHLAAVCFATLAMPSTGQMVRRSVVALASRSPYLQYKYARAVAMKQKTVEGRPGGGWLAKGIAPNDYINFKIPGHPTLSLVVRNAINPHAFQESSELTLQPTGRLRTACLILID